jgi:hypothetical protein
MSGEEDDEGFEFELTLFELAEAISNVPTGAQLASELL